MSWFLEALKWWIPQVKIENLDLIILMKIILLKYFLKKSKDIFSSYNKLILKQLSYWIFLFIAFMLN